MAIGKKTGGRQKGTVNKSTAEIKELAQAHGAEIIEQLAKIALNSDQESTRIAASKELLDRGYGKSMQYSEQTHKVEEGDINMIELARRLALVFQDGLDEAHNGAHKTIN